VVLFERKYCPGTSPLKINVLYLVCRLTERSFGVSNRFDMRQKGSVMDYPLFIIKIYSVEV
jgi:hypothetical protein